MKLKSTTLGILILILFFGSIAASALIGWWQTENGGGQNKGNGKRNNSETHETSTLHGIVNVYDQAGIISITNDDGQILYAPLGNSRYNQSAGFASVTDEGITEKVDGMFDHPIKTYSNTFL